MLCLMQTCLGGFDLFCGYLWLDFVELVQQRGDFPCLDADVNVVEAEAEEIVVGETLAPFVNL